MPYLACYHPAMAVLSSRVPILPLFILIAAPVFAQPRGGIVEVSAVRSVILPIAQARFTLTTEAAVGTSPAQVAGALPELGVKADDLVTTSAYAARPVDFASVNPLPPAARVIYEFRFVVPYSRFDSTAATLSRLTETPPQPIVRLSFRAQAEPLPEAVEETRRRLLPELFREARADAERQLEAAGQSPGPVLFLADQTYSNYVATTLNFSLFLRMGSLGTPSSGGRAVAAIAGERAQPGPADTASYRVSVRLNPEVSRSSVLEIVKPLGIGEADVVSQDYSRGGFYFNLPAISEPLYRGIEFAATRPAAGLASFLNEAAAILARQSAVQMSVSASLSHSQVLVDREALRVTAPLLASARKRAEPLAALLGQPLRLARVVSRDANPLPLVPQFGVAGDFLFSSTYFPYGWHSAAVEFSID